MKDFWSRRKAAVAAETRSVIERVRVRDPTGAPVSR